MRRHIVRTRKRPRPKPPQPEPAVPRATQGRLVLHWRPGVGEASLPDEDEEEEKAPVSLGIEAPSVLRLDEDDDGELPSPGNAKRLVIRRNRLARRVRDPADNATTVETSPLAEQLCAPTRISSLVVPKKTKDEMKRLLKSSALPIVVSGPSGVGKTLLVRLTCESLGMRLMDPGGWEDFRGTLTAIDGWVSVSNSSCCLVVETLEMFEPSRRQVLKRRMQTWCKTVRVIVTVDSAYDMKLSKLKSVNVVNLYEPSCGEISRYASYCCDVLGHADVSRAVASYCQSFRSAVNVISFARGKQDAARAVESDFRSRTIFQAVEDAVSTRGFADSVSAIDLHKRGVHDWCWSSSPNLVPYGDMDSLSRLADLASMSDLAGPLSTAGKSGRIIPQFPELQFALQADALRIVAKPRRDRMRGKVVSPSMMWAGVSSSAGGAGKRLRLDEVFLALKVALAQKKPEALREFLVSAGMDERKFFREASDSFLKMAKWLLKLGGEKPSVAAKVQRWLTKLLPEDQTGIKVFK